jgi:hypothetical protein
MMGFGGTLVPIYCRIQSTYEMNKKIFENLGLLCGFAKIKRNKHEIKRNKHELMIY